MAVAVRELDERACLSPIEHAAAFGGSGPIIEDPLKPEQKLRLGTPTFIVRPDIAGSEIPRTIFTHIKPFDLLPAEFVFKGNNSEEAEARKATQDEVRAGIPLIADVELKYRAKAQKLGYLEPLYRTGENGVVVSDKLIFIVGGRIRNPETHKYNLIPLTDEEIEIFKQFQIRREASPVYELVLREILTGKLGSFGLLLIRFHSSQEVQRTRDTEIKKEDVFECPSSIPDIFSDETIHMSA